MSNQQPPVAGEQWRNMRGVHKDTPAAQKVLRVTPTSVMVQFPKRVRGYSNRAGDVHRVPMSKFMAEWERAG